MTRWLEQNQNSHTDDDDLISHGSKSDIISGFYPSLLRRLTEGEQNMATPGEQVLEQQQMQNQLLGHAQETQHEIWTLSKATQQPIDSVGGAEATQQQQQSDQNINQKNQNLSPTGSPIVFVISNRAWLAMLLLTLSIVFMVAAQYLHLKFIHVWKWWQAILVSWLIAGGEYCLQVPANRIGYQEGMTAADLRGVAEFLLVTFFILFQLFVLKENLLLNQLIGFIIVVCGVILILKSPWGEVVLWQREFPEQVQDQQQNKATAVMVTSSQSQTSTVSGSGNSNNVDERGELVISKYSGDQNQVQDVELAYFNQETKDTALIM